MTNSDLYRTAVTRLEVTEQAATKLHRLISAWQTACGIAVNHAWPNTTSPRALQSALYDELREETGLKSQHAILACEQVADAVTSCNERREQGQSVSKPTFRSKTISYDPRTLTLFDDGTVSLATLGSRVQCDLCLPDNDDGYQYQYIEDDSWELTECTLTYRDSDFYLHLGFKRPEPQYQTPEHRTVLGVDLGVEQLAVTSTGEFFSGREFTHEQREAIKRERELQQTGTRSAYRTLKQVHTRRRRRGRERLHRVANGIIEEALEHDCSVIAFEDLTGIRSRLSGATAVHHWAYRTLIGFVDYRAAARGIDVEQVDPAHTSQRCSHTDCDSVAAENRQTRDRFHCRECGYEVHADYNAAKNIGLRCVRRGHTSSGRTGTGQCALASGILSPDEGFTDKSDAA